MLYVLQEMEGGKVNLLIPTPNAQQKVGFNQDRCVFVYAHVLCTDT